MKSEKALEVAKELMTIFGLVTIQRDTGSSDRNEYEIRISRHHFYQVEIEKLMVLTEKMSLGFQIEDQVIAIWEEEKEQ